MNSLMNACKMDIKYGANLTIRAKAAKNMYIMLVMAKIGLKFTMHY